LLTLYRLYRALLPKPLPGIPYNKDALNNLLGDMPAMVSHIKKTEEMYDWLGQHNISTNHPSPRSSGVHSANPGL
jgi:hypothetical protein